MKKWYLYVLRYNYSGNYYVGITPDLERRMEIHRRRRSKNTNRLPYWSRRNKSIMGFKYYWFSLQEEGSSHSEASHIENAMAAHLVKKLEKVNTDEIIDPKIKLCGGNLVTQEYYKNVEIRNDFPDDNFIDIILEEYLKGLKAYKMKTKEGIFEISFIKNGECEAFDVN